MDFTKRFSPELIRKGRIAVASDPPHGFFADNLGAFLGFWIHDDLIRSVNLVVGENTVLENEPARSPSLAVVDPLVKYPGDSVPDEVVDLHIHHHRLLLPLAHATGLADGHGLSSAVTAAVAEAWSRIGSDSDGSGGRRRWRRRRHGGEVRERRR